MTTTLLRRRSTAMAISPLRGNDPSEMTIPSRRPSSPMIASMLNGRMTTGPPMLTADSQEPILTVFPSAPSVRLPSKYKQASLMHLRGTNGTAAYRSSHQTNDNGKEMDGPFIFLWSDNDAEHSYHVRDYITT